MQEGGKDANYAGISGDADLTYSGDLVMYAITIVNQKDKIIKIEKIMINGDEYSPNDKVIEQILKTEIVIDAEPGKTISLEKTYLAYLKIGLKLRKLRDSEIEPAISNIISMINENKIKGISKEMKEQIKLVTKQNWNIQDSAVRLMIGVSFANNVVRDENTYMMTGQYDPLEKFKVREMIYDILLLRNKMNLGTDV